MPKNFDAKKLRYTAKTRLKKKKKTEKFSCHKIIRLKIAVYQVYMG